MALMRCCCFFLCTTVSFADTFLLSKCACAILSWLHSEYRRAWREADRGAEVSPRRLSVDQRRLSVDPEAPSPDHETNFRRALDHELQRISAFYEKKVQRKHCTAPLACTETSGCGALYSACAAPSSHRKR